MNRPDDEFDDFLARRKPIFGRTAEDPLEPPDDLDRVVLRQAREAIQGDRPQRVFKGPRWGAPLAIAATLVLAITSILHVGMPAKDAPVPTVTVQTISRRVDNAPAPAARSPTSNNYAPAEVAAPAVRVEAADSSDAVVVELNDRARAPMAAGGGLVSEEEANRYASAPAAAPMAGVVIEDPVSGSQTVVTDVSPPPSEAERAVAKAAPAPAFRRDPKTWLAEIERLRAAGKGAQADAEFAEYKREHRAYAVAPDR